MENKHDMNYSRLNSRLNSRRCRMSLGGFKPICYVVYKCEDCTLYNVQDKSFNIDLASRRSFPYYVYRTMRGVVYTYKLPIYNDRNDQYCPGSYLKHLAFLWQHITRTFETRDLVANIALSIASSTYLAHELSLGIF